MWSWSDCGTTLSCFINMLICSSNAHEIVWLLGLTTAWPQLQQSADQWVPHDLMTYSTFNLSCFEAVWTGSNVRNHCHPQDRMSPSSVQELTILMTGDHRPQDRRSLFSGQEVTVLSLLSSGHKIIALGTQGHCPRDTRSLSSGRRLLSTVRRSLSSKSGYHVYCHRCVMSTVTDVSWFIY